MASLPPDLQSRLRKELTACDVFASDRDLQVVFVDPRLAQWRNRVPNAYTPISRFNSLLSTLLDSWTVNGDNALYLFVCVLSEQEKSRDLAELAQDVRSMLIRQKIIECERELTRLEENARRPWSDAAYTAKRKTQLQADRQQWNTRLATTPPLCFVEAQATPKPEVALPENASTNEAYTDLEIHIAPRDALNENYNVTATVDSDSRYWDLQQWNQKIRDALRAETDPDRYGYVLFENLFSGKIYGAYIAARERAKANEDRLRLRLWIDHDAGDLHALSWERLHYQQENSTFRVTTNAKLPFSRYLELQRGAAPVIEGKARMLCVLSNPRDLEVGFTPLDVPTEIANLRSALSRLQRAGMHITLMPGRTGLSADLQAQLEAEGYTLAPGPTTLNHIMRLLAYTPGYHIVHFVGHGTFSERKNQAILVLEDNDGNIHEVTDNSLVNRLNSLDHKPHLVVLAACESASRAANDKNPFVGIAPRLIQIGIPAVVAMQDEMPFPAAQTLTQHFYHFLLQHGIVDKALNQARDFLSDQTGWDVPVLFMHLKEGCLFEPDVLVPINDPPATVPNGATAQLPPNTGPTATFPPNPFIDIQAIRDTERFVGREDELRRLRTMLRGGSVTLLGEPKIGKSSLMWHLAEVWQAENGGRVIGPLDCHGIFDCQDFYEQLSEALGIPMTDDKRALRRVLRKAEGLLLLDEVDYAPSWGLQAEDLALFRAVCSGNPNFKLITVSRTPLKAIFPDSGRGSPAFNFLVPFTLGPLTNADTRRLLAHPWSPDAPAFDAATINDILKLAGAHPFKLQRAAHHCYEALRNPAYGWKTAYEQEIDQLLT